VSQIHQQHRYLAIKLYVSQGPRHVFRFLSPNLFKTSSTFGSKIPQSLRMNKHNRSRDSPPVGIIAQEDAQSLKTQGLTKTNPKSKRLMGSSFPALFVKSSQCPLTIVRFPILQPPTSSSNARKSPPECPLPPALVWREASTTVSSVAATITTSRWKASASTAEATATTSRNTPTSTSS